jgi:hypothetical protein
MVRATLCLTISRLTCLYSFLYIVTANHYKFPSLEEELDMAISNETLQAIIRDYHGIPLSEAELELIRPELDNYLEAIQQLQALDLSNVLSSRLLRVDEGGPS